MYSRILSSCRSAPAATTCCFTMLIQIAPVDHLFSMPVASRYTVLPASGEKSI